MSASTTTLRYPGYMNNDLIGLIASLIPTPRLHFLMTGALFAAVCRRDGGRLHAAGGQGPEVRQRPQNHRAGRDAAPAAGAVAINRRSTFDPPRAAQERDGVDDAGPAARVVLHLHPQHHPGRGRSDPGCYVHRCCAANDTGRCTRACSASGSASWRSSSHGALRRSRRAHVCAPALLTRPQVALSKKSPYLQSAHRVSGVMLANHTSIAQIFQRTASQFDKLRKREARAVHASLGTHVAAGVHRPVPQVPHVSRRPDRV